MKINVNYELIEKWRLENQEPVKEYKLSKEELEEYLNKLEMKKNNKHQLKAVSQYGLCLNTHGNFFSRKVR